MIFAFVVRNCRWLATVPGAPQIFDAALLISTALFSPSRFRAISAVERNVQRLAGVSLGVHHYGGIGFFFRETETGHIHGNGLLDCFVGRENRDLLLRRPPVSRRITFFQGPVGSVFSSKMQAMLSERSS